MFAERPFFDWLTSKGKSLAVASRAAAFVAAVDKTGVDVTDSSAVADWLMTLKSPNTRADYARAFALWAEYRAVYSGDDRSVPMVPQKQIERNRPQEPARRVDPGVEASSPAARPVAAIPPAFGALPSVPAQVIAPPTPPPTLAAMPNRIDASDEKPLPTEFVEFILARYSAPTAAIYQRNIRRIRATGVRDDAPTIDPVVETMQPGTRRAYLAAWRAWLSWRATQIAIPAEGVWLLQRLVEAGATVTQLTALRRCHVGARWIDDPTSDKPSQKLGVEIASGHARKAIDALFGLPGDEDTPLFGVHLDGDLIRKLTKAAVPDPALPTPDEDAAEALDDPDDKAEALGWYVPVPPDALPGESSFDYLLRTGNDPHAIDTLPVEPS